MILSKHVFGKLSRYGFLTAVALGMAALSGSSPGQAAPPVQASSSTPPAPSDQITATRGERALLEARLQKIEATLELILSRLNGGEDKADRDANRSPSVSGRKLSTLRPLTAEFTSDEGVILDAADRHYGIVHENGRPALQAVEPSSGTLIWQNDLGTGLSVGDKALWQLSKTEDGKLLRVEAASEDASLAFTIDAETGRTIKQEITGESTPQVTVVGRRRVPLGPTTTGRYLVSTLFRSPRPALPDASAPQGELVVLATSYVDAVGNLKLARSKYEQLKALRSSAATAASSSELQAAAINLETAQQKLTVLTTFVQAAYETAIAELDFAERMYATGFLTLNQVVALKAKVNTLESIVQQRGAAGSHSSTGVPSSFAPRQ